MGLGKRVQKIGKEDVEHNWERFWCDRQNLTSRFNWERFLAPSRRPRLEPRWLCVTQKCP
jgi:hypothetical protein